LTIPDGKLIQGDMNQTDVIDMVVARIRALNKTDTPTVRRLRRELSKSLRGESGCDIVELADRLLDQESAVPRFVAYELVLHHPEAGQHLDGRAVARLGRGLDSWGAVDCFSCYIAGPAWRAGRISDSLIEQWARSKDRWWRRAALVSTVPLNNKTQGGNGDAGRTLRICRALAADRDDMVVKALSWALRELAKRDRAAVEAFLEEQGGSLAARVVREVRNKMKTGRKNPERK
jgi:3-methyladenine DNA glycosylase AlkD